MNFLFFLLAGVILFELAHLVLLKWEVNKYKTYWQQQASAQVPPDALWYVALGDSAAQGIGASDPARGYVGLVADSLHQKTDRPIHVVNLGVSGAKVNDVITDQLPQLHQLSLPKDSVVSLEIGANDMVHFESNDFRQKFDQLLSAMPRQTVVSDVPYFGGGIFRSRETSVVAANQIMNKLIVQHGFKLVPLHEVTMKRSSWLNNSADLFHPNNRGYRGWYEAFWQVLDTT